jgi:hypothetical protein
MPLIDELDGALRSGPISDSVVRFVRLPPFCHKLDLEMCGKRQGMRKSMFLLGTASTFPAQSAFDCSLGRFQTRSWFRVREREAPGSNLDIVIAQAGHRQPKKLRSNLDGHGQFNTVTRSYP